MAKTFSGERMRNARLYRGITLTDLAGRTGLTKQALSQYENGTISPTGSSLLLLAHTLNFPIEYFSGKQTHTVKSQAAYFRSLMSTNKKDRIAQTVRLEFLAQIYEALANYVDFPSPNLPNVSFSDVFRVSADEDAEIEELERIAAQVRDHWRLGREPIKDLRYTLEANGIIISCVSLNAEEIDAFSQRMLINGNEVFFIVISRENQSIARARFDMGHELGHILLHPWSEDIETITRDEFKTRERQANMVASAFLLPRETFGFDARRYPTSLGYYQHLKAKWNVSIVAMIYRSRQLGIITPSQYQYLMRQISKNGWRSLEPYDQPYTADSTLLQSAVNLLLDSKILTVEGLLNTLAAHGIMLYPDEIEGLLCLAPGTLESTVQPKSNLLRVKFPRDSTEQ